jgi:methyltransferase (TIGR00027 family)
MHPIQICRQQIRFGAGLLAFLAVLILARPPSLAVDLGKLSVTAEGTTASRAIFSQHPDEKVRNPDYLALKLVDPEYWRYSLLKPDYETAAMITKLFRMYTNYYVNARTHHMDAVLRAAASDGITQVVNLGAGYDSRAYRFHRGMPGVRFFEIDLPEMIEEKKRRIEALLGNLPDYVTYVPIDFSSQNIPDELARAGYDSGQKTFFVWEGVTYYIPGEAVESTLAFIAERSVPGSAVVFDYMPLAAVKGDFKTYPDARSLSFWVANKGEPFMFGIPGGQGEAFVRERGLVPVSDLGPKELEARYLTRSDGTLDGPCASFFRIMHAKVPAR